LRIRQFNSIDKSRKKSLTYAEVENGLLEIVKLPQNFDLKPVIRRAFEASVSDIKKVDEDYPDEITNRNYRLMLKYLR